MERECYRILRPKNNFDRDKKKIIKRITRENMQSSAKDIFAK